MRLQSREVSRHIMPGGRVLLLSIATLAFFLSVKALTTARRLGLSFSHSHSQSPSRSSAADCAASPRHPAAAAAPAATTHKNARQCRSAARSARRHAARRAQLCTRSMLSLLFIVRLRRMVDGTLGVDHEVSSVLAKRGPDERPPSSLSSSRSTSASSTRMVGQPPVGALAVPPVPHGPGRQEKRPKSGLLAGFLLR